MNTFGERKGIPFAAKIVIAVILGLLASLAYKGMFLSNSKIDPVLLSQLVSKYAKKYSLDEDFVHAIIKAESSENPRAVSKVGAIGLMQLMPNTAQYLASKMGEPTPSKQMLMKPDNNVRFGCYYLGILKKQFGNKPEVILAAYNAGPTRVRRWLSANQDKDAVEVVVNCPFRETRRYIQRVLMYFNDRKEGRL